MCVRDLLHVAGTHLYIFLIVFAVIVMCIHDVCVHWNDCVFVCVKVCPHCAVYCAPCFFFRSCFVCIVLLLSHCTPHCLERGETPQQLFKRSRAQINSSTTTTHHTQSAVQRLCKRFCRSVELHKKINPLRALEFVVLRLDR